MVRPLSLGAAAEGPLGAQPGLPARRRRPDVRGRVLRAHRQARRRRRGPHAEGVVRMTAAPVLVETALLATLGACLGSFAATAALRFSRAEPFIAGRSHCDACGMRLGFAATLPLVSYVGL